MKANPLRSLDRGLGLELGEEVVAQENEEAPQGQLEADNSGMTTDL